ncbi:MAG: metalloregulator ArsR/SmtB family transcription factor [Xanthomonadales bacterium]|nr:metalloregulator ArsR/SmtB family transcription factor [Xanthomonadales bacterium]
MTSEAVNLNPALNPVALFRALADETRLRALVLLHSEGELCVCELTEALQVSQPKMSRHVASLRELGLVAGRRDGLWIHYYIAPDLPQWAHRTLQAGCAGLVDQAPFRDDRRRLSAMADRPGDRCATSISEASA